MQSQTLEQPWQKVADSARVPLTNSQSTWLDGLDDKKDAPVLSDSSCIQAAVKMNLVVEKQPFHGLEQPWKNVKDDARVTMPSVSKSTFLDGLDDDKDAPVLSDTACIQAQVKMNLLVTKKDEQSVETN